VAVLGHRGYKDWGDRMAGTYTGVVDQYCIEEFIGIGGMSEVYRGRSDSGDVVAIKVMHAELCLSEELTVRFLNEGALLSSLQGSSIVQIFAHGRLDSGVPFMVIEWLPWSLARALGDRSAGLSMPAVVHIATSVAKGLVSLHDRGIVHRDLKPDNILLADGDLTRTTIKVADLGMAKVPGSGRSSADVVDLLPISTAGSTLLGSWDYMPPEQWIRSKEVTPAADVYSFGIMLFQLLTGRLPFAATEQRELMYLHLFNPPPLQLLDGRTTLSMQRLIAQMLDKRPAGRPSIHQIFAEIASA